MRVLVLALTLALAPPALAQPTSKLKPEAQVHLDAFLAAYERKDWETALAELDLAYAADPNPALLYSKAQTLRLANRCADAIAIYKKYLEHPLTTEQQAAARTQIQTCEKTLASQPKPEPKPEPPRPEPPRPEPPAEPRSPVVAVAPRPEPVAIPPRDDAARPWYKDPIGGALVGGGVAGVVVGVVFLRKASASESAANDAEFRDEFLAKLEDAESQKRIGWISIGVGGALIAGGVAAYVVRSRAAPRDRVTLSTDGRSVFVVGAF